MYPGKCAPIPSDYHGDFVQCQDNYVTGHPPYPTGHLSYPTDQPLYATGHSYATGHPSYIYPQPHSVAHSSHFSVNPQPIQFINGSTSYRYHPYASPSSQSTFLSSGESSVSPSALYEYTGLCRRSTPVRGDRENRKAATRGKGDPKIKRQKYQLVLAVEGALIRCHWGDCDQIVEATRDAIQAHGKQHLEKDGRCYWRDPEGRSKDQSRCKNARAENVGKHIGSHLHQEGQPSPWIEVCECGYKRVNRGSGNAHKPGCRFKKTIAEKPAVSL